MVMNPKAEFAIARELRSPEGAALGAVFSFVSGLYFRGKLTYASMFGAAAVGVPSAHVICAGGGLCTLDERVSLGRLQGWAGVAIDETNPHFTVPLIRHTSALLEVHGETARFVLLGSVATNKYVLPLLEVLGKQLLFPSEFAGRGDMSRGALLLDAARDGRELAYVPVLSASRHGPRSTGLRGWRSP